MSKRRLARFWMKWFESGRRGEAEGVFGGYTVVREWCSGLNGRI